ncbi:MAG TPA: DUF4257 domain-containing protein [Terriglobia bacterium]|nr:DUF4257 domain-containing protein [Terriglobia bacterium]
MDANTGLTPMEKYSIVATIVLGVALALLAWASAHYGWTLWLAASVGALGGLVHEIAQSGGKVAFFQRYQDGFYLGSVAGMILGAVAGLLVVRGLVAGNPSSPPSMTTAQIAYEVFTAGLALKGVAEAAGGNAVKA